MNTIGLLLALTVVNMVVVGTAVHPREAEPAPSSTRSPQDPPPVDPNQPGGPQTEARAKARHKDEEEKENDRVENAGTVLSEILDIPDDIPQDILNKARCVIVFPSILKAAFIVGGSYGRGVMTCRTHKDYNGPWGAPTMMALEGGSVGFQIGGQATDFVILVMNNRGVDSVLHSKVKLGGDASIAAGPKGRDASAESDITLRAEMLSYSRSRGLFAGVSLEGSTVRPDNDANKRIYGKEVSTEDIITESRLHAPDSAYRLLARLQKASPRRKD